MATCPISPHCTPLPHGHMIHRDQDTAAQLSRQFPNKLQIYAALSGEIVVTLSDGTRTSSNGIRTYISRGCHSLGILRYLTILNLLLVTCYSPPQRYVTLHMITRCHGQRCCVAADWQLERGEVTASHHRVRVMLADSCHTFTATTKYPLIILFILYAMELVPHFLLPVLFSSLGQTNFTHRPNIPKYAAPVTLWSRR